MYVAHVYAHVHVEGQRVTSGNEELLKLPFYSHKRYNLGSPGKHYAKGEVVNTV